MCSSTSTGRMLPSMRGRSAAASDAAAACVDAAAFPIAVLTGLGCVDTVRRTDAYSISRSSVWTNARPLRLWTPGVS